MIKILRGWFKTALLVFVFASFGCCTMGEEAALGEGTMLSGTGLSGSDRYDNDSNLKDTSREAVISNKDVEKLGILHWMHSHAILLLNDLL